MVTSRRNAPSPAHRGTAVSARERLLQDQVMRRNTPFSPSLVAAEPPQPAITASISMLPVSPLPLEDPADLPSLSPAEQHEHALEIAQSFKDFYLAHISYHKQYDVVMAIVKPSSRGRHTPLSHKIIVDRCGNVNVFEYYADLLAARSLLRWGWRLALMGGLVSLLGSVLLYWLA